MYDLIVLGYSTDYVPIFSELAGHKGVHLISPQWKNERELLYYLLRLEFAYKKNIVPFSSENPLCYILFRDWYPLFANGYIKRLKEQFPGTKACWFFSDLVETYPQINIKRMQQEFDLILTFDPEDAERYGFVHCPLPYSFLQEAEEWQKQAVSRDVFFMGSAKQRLDKIFAVFKRLRDAGLNCDFHIVGVPEKEQRYVEEIDYCGFIPYQEYLQKALSSRCILELLQDPIHHGYTVRTAEAVVYGRKLLSDNSELVTASFYDPRQIRVFSSPNEIDVDFIRDGWQSPIVPDFFSPKHTLKLIERCLDIKLAMCTK